MPHQVTLVFVLLLVYQLKHFLADYPMQTSYMLGKFKDKGWVLPLAAHAGIHAMFTFGIAEYTLMATREHPSLFVVPFVLAAFDFAVHFTMDRIKAAPKLMGRWKALSATEYFAANITATKVTIQGAENAVSNAQKRIRNNTWFWYALGFDQMVHHLTHYAVIAYLVLT